MRRVLRVLLLGTAIVAVAAGCSTSGRDLPPPAVPATPAIGARPS